MLPLSLLFIFWIKFNASIGMLVTGVRIVDSENYEKPSITKLIKRFIGFILSHFTFYLNSIHVAFDSRKQNWYEKVSKTNQINKKYCDIAILLENKDNSKDKIILISGVVVFSTLLIFTGILFFKLFIDEKLLPEVKEWIALDENVEDNGYYYLVGFMAPEGFDPHTYGYNKIQRINNEFKSKRDSCLSILDNNDIYDPENIKHRKNFEKYYIFFENEELSKIDSLAVKYSEEDIVDISLDSLNLTNFKKDFRMQIEQLNMRYAKQLEYLDRFAEYKNFTKTIYIHFNASSLEYSDFVNIYKLRLYNILLKEDAYRSYDADIEPLNKLCFNMMNGSGVIEKLLGGILYQFNVMITNLIIEDTSPEKLNGKNSM
jgi:hypothetical protein